MHKEAKKMFKCGSEYEHEANILNHKKKLWKENTARREICNTDKSKTSIAIYS